MECKDVKVLWKDFMGGTISEKFSLEIENHLETCEFCRAMLDETIEKQENQQNGSNSNLETNQPVSLKKQKQIIRRAKWKNRVSNVVTVFISFILICTVLSTFTYFYYGIFDDNSKLSRAEKVLKAVTEMTMPNISAQGGGTNIHMLLNADLNYQMLRTIGKENEPIGEIHGKMLLNHLEVNRSWTAGSYDVKLEFYYPNVSNSVNKKYKSQLANVRTSTWNALEKLPEGTVSELAISFDDLYNLDQVFSLLENYDFDITWYAIDTGGKNMPMLEDFPFSDAITGIWGFHEYTLLEFTGESGSTRTLTRNGNAYEQAYKNMLTFLIDNEKYVRDYLPELKKGDLKHMLDYMNKNGFKSYGVVVTGPTKELLKLRENNKIIYATLGEVDLWNWNGSDNKGTMY